MFISCFLWNNIWSFFLFIFSGGRGHSLGHRDVPHCHRWLVIYGTGRGRGVVKIGFKIGIHLYHWVKIMEALTANLHVVASGNFHFCGKLIAVKNKIKKCHSHIKLYCPFYIQTSLILWNNTNQQFLNVTHESPCSVLRFL